MKKTASLTDLVSIRTLEKIQDNFAEATGISCVMRDLKGEAITRFTKPTRLWLEVIKHPEIEQELQTGLFQGMEKCLKTGQVQIIQRYIDTYAFIVPIGIDGRTIAFLVGGLIRYGNPNIEHCAKEAQRLGVDLDTFLEMFLELAMVTKERLEAAANLFKIVASSLSSLAREGTEAKAKADEMASLNDILEKEMEMASLELKESEERYRKLFNTINDGVYIADLEGRVKDINPAGARMLGYTRGDLISSNLKNLYVNPGDRDVFVKTLLRKGHIENFHPFIRLKNGQTKYFETNSTVIKDQYGKIVGVQGIFRDISRRHSDIHNKSTNHVTPKTAIARPKNH